MSQLIAAPVHAAPEEPTADTREFYLRSLALLDQADVPYLVGGGYATAYYTGISRRTKDLDLFCRPADRDRVLATLEFDGGYPTDLTWPHFLAKVLHGDAFIDVIYRSGNGLCEVDDEWFRHAVRADIWGYPVHLCPPEETLWSKAYVQERDRFDGADVAHLILRQGDSLNWRRLLRRFRRIQGERVLLAHLILFGFIYPGEKHRVPDWVVAELFDSIQDEHPTANDVLCQGTLLSKYMYVHDVEFWGYRDPRLPPHGALTQQEIVHFQATTPLR
jgi:hypothetical protein